MADQLDDETIGRLACRVIGILPPSRNDACRVLMRARCILAFGIPNSVEEEQEPTGGCTVMPFLREGVPGQQANGHEVRPANHLHRRDKSREK